MNTNPLQITAVTRAGTPLPAPPYTRDSLEYGLSIDPDCDEVALLNAYDPVRQVNTWTPVIPPEKDHTVVFTEHLAPEVARAVLTPISLELARAISVMLWDTVAVPRDAPALLVVRRTESGLTVEIR